MITVYVVDDHPFVREGLKTFLGTNKDIMVVGESGAAEDALKEIEKLIPNVAVIDLRLPSIGGIELTRLIKQRNISTQIIILSSFCEDHEVTAAIDAGALSYLMKDSPPQLLVEAVFKAKAGESIMEARILKKLLKRGNGSGLVEDLTLKEKEVLSKLVKGFSNKEIASELFISETTVKTHISRILAKLEVKDRTQAVIKAIENKLYLK